MKPKKSSPLYKIFFLIFLLATPLSAFAKEFSILKWQENTNLSARGKNSEIWIQGQVNAPKNMAMSSFSISFNPSRKMTMNKVLCDGKPVDFSFSKNVLNVKFAQPKSDQETTLIYFVFREYYDEVHESLREEVIEIPAFAAGANARVALNFPGYMESATLNPNITKSGNSFIYSNIVPKNGVVEIVKLTNSKSVWDVSIKFKASSDRPLKEFNLRVPNYFQSEHQLVENHVTMSSIQPYKKAPSSDEKLLNFDVLQKEILIENKARITTGETARRKVSRNPDLYLKVTQEEVDLVSPLLQKVINDLQYKGLPLYAGIGKFVNQYFKYDLSYSGKLPPLKDFIQNHVGVCTEYARLYNIMARLAKIPSFIIEGAACGEYAKCRGHSWNMIYINGDWIEVDPTWNLMSGVVSSSHIYFNEAGKGEARIDYFESNPIRLEMDFEMKETAIISK